MHGWKKQEYVNVFYKKWKTGAFRKNEEKKNYIKCFFY